MAVDGWLFTIQFSTNLKYGLKRVTHGPTMIVPMMVPSRIPMISEKPEHISEMIAAASTKAISKTSLTRPKLKLKRLASTITKASQAIFATSATACKMMFMAVMTEPKTKIARQTM